MLPAFRDEELADETSVNDKDPVIVDGPEHFLELWIVRKNVYSPISLIDANERHEVVGLKFRQRSTFHPPTDVHVISLNEDGIGSGCGIGDFEARARNPVARHDGLSVLISRGHGIVEELYARALDMLTDNPCGISLKISGQEREEKENVWSCHGLDPPGGFVAA